MWYVRDVLYAVLYVRVSCFVVRGCGYNIITIIQRIHAVSSCMIKVNILITIIGSNILSY